MFVFSTALNNIFYVGIYYAYLHCLYQSRPNFKALSFRHNVAILANPTENTHSMQQVVGNMMLSSLKIEYMGPKSQFSVKHLIQRKLSFPCVMSLVMMHHHSYYMFNQKNKMGKGGGPSTKPLFFPDQVYSTKY